MSKKEIIKSLYNRIDDIEDYIKNLGKLIYKNPEIGFKEIKTNKIISEALDKLNVRYSLLDGIPGVKVVIDTGIKGPNIAVLSELDALICPNHKDSSDDGAVHACGHNVMVANMLGLIKAIKDTNIKNALSGTLHFIAVPAEEYIDLEFRNQLIKEGKISYPTGKVELLHRGLFDKIDLCVMMHVANGDAITVDIENNGFITKKIRYIGKSAHTSRPQNGVNALYAANIGLMALNSIRDTFKEESFIRVHPIITKGGDAINVVPSEVTLETFIRGRNMVDILSVNNQVDYAFLSGAIAMGADLEIIDSSGMLPLKNDKELMILAEETAVELVGHKNVSINGSSFGSADLGDISSIMPVIEIGIGCVSGGLHSADYKVIDEHAAYVNGTKMLGGMIVKLLGDGGLKAKSVINAYHPLFSSKKAYFLFINDLFKRKYYKHNTLMEVWSDK